MKLRIYFSATWHDSASPCPWALCDDAGAVLQSGTAPLASLPKADEYVGIISAARLTCVSVTMPAQSRRRWEAALPFVAEEYTLTDPEENHVVPAGPIQKDGQRPLFIVDKQWLKNIISASLTANIPLRRALPEMLLPELPPDAWVVVWDGEKGYLRTDAYSGMALDYGNDQHPPLALRLCLNNAATTSPPKIHVRRLPVENETETALPQWGGLASELIPGEHWDWQRAPIPNDTLNLLWGELAPKARLHEWLPKLRPLALILLAALIIETAGTNIEWAMLNQAKAIAMRNMEQTFRQAFGDSSVVVNPALQMQRNITELRHTVGVPDEADFLPLLDRAAQSLATLSRGSIAGLHYESGRIDIDLKAVNEAEIRALLPRLKNNGFNIHQGEILDTGKGVETRLTIQIGGIS